MEICIATAITTDESTATRNTLISVVWEKPTGILGRILISRVPFTRLKSNTSTNKRAKKDRYRQLGILANTISKAQTGLIEPLTEVSEPEET